MVGILVKSNLNFSWTSSGRYLRQGLEDMSMPFRHLEYHSMQTTAFQAQETADTKALGGRCLADAMSSVKASRGVEEGK